MANACNTDTGTTMTMIFLVCDIASCHTSMCLIKHENQVLAEGDYWPL